jgi:hypothetical protein
VKYLWYLQGKYFLLKGEFAVVPTNKFVGGAYHKKIAVGGANIQIVHYYDHGYLEEEKSMIHSFTVTFGAKYLTGMVTRVVFLPTNGPGLKGSYLRAYTKFNY